MNDLERNGLLCKAANLTSQAEIARSTGDFEKAVKCLREALNLKRQALGPQDAGIDLTLDNLDALWGVMQEMASWHNDKAPNMVPIVPGGLHWK